MSDNGLGELERLTVGETLLIDRRRRNETQRVAAKRLGVTQFAYGRMERDLVPGVKKAGVLPLKAHERCLIYRRRSESTQTQVAKDLGCCRFWLNRMECGLVPCDALLWYWEQ